MSGVALRGSGDSDKGHTEQRRRLHSDADAVSTRRSNSRIVLSDDEDLSPRGRSRTTASSRSSKRSSSNNTNINITNNSNSIPSLDVPTTSSRRRRRRHRSSAAGPVHSLSDSSDASHSSSSSTNAQSSRASTSSVSADIVQFDVATRPPGSTPKPVAFAVRSPVPPAPAPTMRADELEHIAHAEMLKVRLHSPRGAGAGAPLVSSKSMISPRALAAARSASVRPLELAPVPPTQGSIVKLVKPKHVAPSPPSSASPQPQPSPPIAVASARSPRSPRRKSTRGHGASNTSNDSSSPAQVRSTVSSSPRSPRMRHRSPRRHKSPAPTSPRRHHSSSHATSNSATIVVKSPPLSPRLEPDEYRAALRDVRAELKALAERHEAEVGDLRSERDELRAERDELRLRLDAAERRLRAFEASGATATIAPTQRSPSRRNRHRSTGSRVSRDPTYHVSTSSSSAEKQLSALDRKKPQPSMAQPGALSTSSSEGPVEKRLGGSKVLSSAHKPQQTGSSSDDEAAPPRAAPAAVRARSGSESSESIIIHGAASATVTPARAQQPDTMSTIDSVVLAGAEDVSYVDEDDANVEIVEPTHVEIVETVKE